MALTKSVASVTDWTAVAAAAVGESDTVDVSGCYEASLHIQAFLDSGTAHEGTEFIIQTSSNTTGNEDWEDLTRFIELVGTAESEAITDNPLTAGSTTLLCASTTGFTVDAQYQRWVAIEDGTLVNSELVFQTGFTANTNITILDGTTNEHAQNTLMWSLAFSKVISLPITANRVRVVVNNNFDADGTASSLNYRVRINKVTAL